MEHEKEVLPETSSRVSSETASTVRQPAARFRSPSPLPSGPGRLPACWGRGLGVPRGPGKGVPAPEATHVSSRIFLSATTSPVNLFLALYTTPYVPSPIFSTF